MFYVDLCGLFDYNHNQRGDKLKHYIAVDIGASSGRAILSNIDNNQIKTQEINRFANGFTTQNQQEVWDVDYLFEEIIVSLKKAKAMGITECYLSIDTWGVDYLFLDHKGKRLQNAVSYRDSRTDTTMDKLFTEVSKYDIFQKTGIQFLTFNTIYQLFEETHALKDQAHDILLIPDYLNYLLTNEKRNEITNLSTTQLLSVHDHSLDQALLTSIGIDKAQFPNTIEPGTYIGEINADLNIQDDLPVTHVYATASHDTASAVLGSVGDAFKKWAFLSSGTWSLIGKELESPIVTEKALELGYSNERGMNHTYRFLKNIIGMWIIQRIRKDWPENYTFPEMVEEAKQHQDFKVYIDFNDQRFINPDCMVDEIKNYCIQTNQTVPQTLGEIVQSVYMNLAIIYAISIEELNEITKEPIEVINIVGGGSNNDYLNELTALYTNCDVIVGPTEATIYGNLAATMIGTGEFENIQEARAVIKRSTDTTKIDKPELKHIANQDIKTFKGVTHYEYV